MTSASHGVFDEVVAAYEVGLQRDPLPPIDPTQTASFSEAAITYTEPFSGYTEEETIISLVMDQFLDCFAPPSWGYDSDLTNHDEIAFSVGDDGVTYDEEDEARVFAWITVAFVCGDRSVQTSIAFTARKHNDGFLSSVALDDGTKEFLVQQGVRTSLAEPLAALFQSLREMTYYMAMPELWRPIGAGRGAGPS